MVPTEADHLEVSVKLVRMMQVMEIAKQIHSTLDLDRILATFLKIAVQELETEGGTIYFLDTEKNILESRHVISTVPTERIILQMGEGIAGHVAESGKHVIENDVQREQQFSDSLDRKLGYRTRNIICFPLKDEQSSVIGVLQLVNKKRGDFTEEDAEFLGDISIFVAMAIKNAQYLEDSVVKARMEQEMNVAREIQQKLLPQSQPDIPGFETHGFFQPCYETAGDFYNFYPGDNAHFVVLVDVSGKGVGAAMVANSIHTFLTLRLPHEDSLVTTASELNEFLYTTLEGEKYATGVIFRISGDGSLSYLSAGHPPVLKIGGKSDQMLTSTSPPLGILPGMVFEEKSVEMEAGEIVCIYSDGYNETPNSEEEEFGVERLVDLLKQADRSELSKIAAHVNREVDAFKGDLPNHDDKTMILIRRG